MLKTILITNGRFPATLDLIRSFADEGHKVIVAETNNFHYCYSSKATYKNITIPSPRDNEKGYIETILQIIETEKVDFFLPAWEDVLVVSKHLNKFPDDVAFTSDYKLVHALHNKWEFAHLIESLGFHSPKTILVKSKEELQSVPFENFYVKCNYSRGSEGAIFIRDKKRVAKNVKKYPVIVQEKLEGEQYCTYTVCHKGKITAHATYPLHYQKYNANKTRGNYCLSFEEVHHQKIYTFVKEFAEKTGYTGSLAFDIFEEGEQITILECNPRLTSGITLLTPHKELAAAFFNELETPLFPKEGEQRQFLMPSIFFASKTAIKNGSFFPFLKTLFKSKDIIFRKNDIKPFFFQPVIGIYNIYLKLKYRKSMISSYSHDLDYEEEEKETL
ncbi:ATP-grasp domain-containing protein [bacterium]|nr:ATP-grasp domain-containing protein [bacterium]